VPKIDSTVRVLGIGTVLVVIPIRAVLNSLGSPASRRVCEYAIDPISRVKGVKQFGFRAGNWLSAEFRSAQHAYGDSVRARPDYAMLAMLFGCGFLRSELVGFELDEIQMRQRHWAVVEMIGKGAHIRTVPIPEWVKSALDQWTAAAGVTEGRIFRAVARLGKVWGNAPSSLAAALDYVPYDILRDAFEFCAPDD
jgi:hypothetical protein